MTTPRTLKQRHDGRGGTFRVEKMFPSEFTFKTIMERKGVKLFYNAGAGGKTFSLPNGSTYRPDFHILHTTIYYEVSSTMAIFSGNKGAYRAFRKHYPDHTLICVQPDGTELPLD